MSTTAVETFTGAHFAEWAKDLVLDSGDPFEIEPFEAAFVQDVFDDKPAVWLVVPEGSGKTTLVSALALYHALHKPTAFVPVAASSRDQAEWLYRQADGFVIRSPKIQMRFKCQEGFRRIKVPENGSRIQIFAADDRTGDGAIFSLAILDELHRHRNLRLYRTWSGKRRKRRGQVVAISTAGEPNSEFEQVRQKVIAEAPADQLTIDGPYIRAEAGGIVLHDWALRDERMVDDMEAVAEANPREDVTAEVLAEKRDDPSMTPAHWLRFTCNVAAALDGGPWLPNGAWQACEQKLEIPEGAEVWGGIDLGMKHDTAALVWVWERGEDRYVVDAEIIEPPNDGSSLDVAHLEQRVREASKKYAIKAIAYDPWRFERSAQILGDEGFLMVEHPMTNARMAPASEQLYEAIIARRIAHNGDETLASHVTAGVPTETERGWRLTKRKAKDKIDALIALVIAYDLAVRGVETQPDSSVYFS